MQIVTILISAMCLFMISGCNSNSNVENEKDQIVDIQYKVLGEDPVILLHDLADAGMDMAVSGTLKYDSNSKCLFLYDRTEDKMITPIWPEGTTSYFENELHGVDIPDYGKILEGDDVSTGGGGIERSNIVDLDYPSGCLDNDNIVVITPEL